MGSSSFSEDITLKKYELKFDELSLLNRTKILTIGNSNNVGLLAYNISGSKNNTYQELDNIKFEQDTIEEKSKPIKVRKPRKTRIEKEMK